MTTARARAEAQNQRYKVNINPLESAGRGALGPRITQNIGLPTLHSQLTRSYNELLE